MTEMTQPATSMQPATVGKRVGALLLDTLLVFVPLSIVGAVLFGSAEAGGGSASLQLTGLPFVATVLIWFLYFFGLEAATGQTLGKKIVGIKVVADTGPLSAGAVAIRTLLRIVDALPFAYLVGFIVALVNDDNKRVGDLVAKTRVVDSR